MWRVARRKAWWDGARCLLPRRHLSGFSAPAPRRLDTILGNIDSLRKTATPEDLTAIWERHNTGRGVIGAVMTKESFNKLHYRAKACPLFVFPIQQRNGYISYFLQAQMPHLLFTGLEDYKVRGTNASPYFTVAHYSELAETNGVVLVRGDIVFTSKLSDQEGGKQQTKPPFC